MGYSDEQNRPKRKATLEIQNIGNGSPKIQQQQNDSNNASRNKSCSSTSGRAIIPENYGFDNNDYINELKKRKYFESFPPGYRFCPDDSELIDHYLSKKVRLEKLPPNKIQDVILYKYNPEELIANHPIQGEKETEWFFFTPRDRKYKNGMRPNRAASDGYWKATGADKSIIENGITIGFRKALVFYRGKPPKGKKTNWIMHEFRVNEPPRTKSGANDMRLDDCVLCRVYYKEEKAKTTQDGYVEDGEPNGSPNENCQLANEIQVREETHCDYNDLMGYSNGLMNTSDYYGLLHFQNGPYQEIPPFDASVQLKNFSSLPFQPMGNSNYEALPVLRHRPPPFGAPTTTARTLSAQPFQPTSSNYEALPVNHRLPPPTIKIHPTENVVLSEFMKEYPRQFPTDNWSNTNFEDFDLDSLLEYLDTNYMQSLDSIFPNNTPEQPPK